MKPTYHKAARASRFRIGIQKVEFSVPQHQGILDRLRVVIRPDSFDREPEAFVQPKRCIV
jgi:hypothetical protein